MLKTNPSSINWKNQESYFLYHSKQKEEAKKVLKKLPSLKGHIFLFSSSFEKIILLSKKALLTSAQSINEHLQCKKTDRWLICLPRHHISGLSIQTRSFCGKFSTFTMKGSWNPQKFLKILKKDRITLCSLVPTQVYDLIQNNCTAPPHLRAVVVGGEALSPSLYKEARKRNWPLLPSYGLTECGSQVATASLSSLKKSSFPPLTILNHIQIKQTKEGLKIKSPALLEGVFHLKEGRFRPFTSSWFSTEDQGVVKGNFLKVQGRKDNQVKILGKLTHLDTLSEILNSLTLPFKLQKSFYLLPLPHERKGFEITLITTLFKEKEVFKILQEFNKQVLSYQRIEKVYFVPKIKSSSLKVKTKDLKKQIGLL